MRRPTSTRAGAAVRSLVTDLDESSAGLQQQLPSPEAERLAQQDRADFGAFFPSQAAADSPTIDSSPTIAARAIQGSRR